MSENEESKLKAVLIDDKLVSEHFDKLIPKLDEVNSQLSEIGKDMYEKMNMTGYRVLCTPGPFVLNHCITLNRQEFNMKAEMLITQYNQIVSEIFQLNYVTDHVIIKDTGGEDALSSHLKQAADFREKRLAGLHSQLQALKDAWAELRRHIVVYTPITGETIMPITHVPDMPSLVVSPFTR